MTLITNSHSRGACRQQFEPIVSFFTPSWRAKQHTFMQLRQDTLKPHALNTRATWDACIIIIMKLLNLEGTEYVATRWTENFGGDGGGGGVAWLAWEFIRSSVHKSTLTNVTRVTNWSISSYPMNYNFYLGARNSCNYRSHVRLEASLKTFLFNFPFPGSVIQFFYFVSLY
jgi:hypothetical protein